MVNYLVNWGRRGLKHRPQLTNFRIGKTMFNNIEEKKRPLLLSVLKSFDGMPKLSTSEYESWRNNVLKKQGLVTDGKEFAAKVISPTQQINTVDPEKTFEAMVTSEKTINQAVAYLRKWNWYEIKQLSNPNKKIPLGLYIHGSHDASKTHLMHGFINHIFKKGMLESRKYQFYNWNALMKSLKDFDAKGWINDAATKSSIECTMAKETEHRCKHYDLIIFDDIGSNNATRYDLETITDIIEFRLAHKKDTFFTSNHSLNDLAKVLDKRIAQKILEKAASVNIKNEEKNRHEIQKKFQKEYYEH